MKENMKEEVLTKEVKEKSPMAIRKSLVPVKKEEIVLVEKAEKMMKENEASKENIDKNETKINEKENIPIEKNQRMRFSLFSPRKQN